MSRTQALNNLVAEWEAMARGTTQFDAALRVAAFKLREVLAGYPETGAVTEWGAGFVDGGHYNTYSTEREAEAFVQSMNSVGAKMVVLTREHTPAVSGEWVRVDD